MPRFSRKTVEDTSHLCPGGCNRRVPNYLLACPYHWGKVPPDVQGAVYAAYRARRLAPADRAKIAAHQAAVAAATRYMTPPPPTREEPTDG